MIKNKKLDKVLVNDVIFNKLLVKLINNNYSILRIFNILKSEYNYNEINYLYNKVNNKYNNVY